MEKKSWKYRGGFYEVEDLDTKFVDLIEGSERRAKVVAHSV